MTITEAFALHDLHVLQGDGRKAQTRKNYAIAASSLVSAVGDIPVVFLGTDHIVKWKLAMRDKGNAATTINTNLSKVRQLLQFLTDNEVKVLNPTKITRDKEIRPPREILSPEDIKLLKKHTNCIRDEAIIDLYFGTGCRLTEVLNLDRSDFEEAKEVAPGLFEIWVCGKGDKYRPVCFRSSVKRTVDAYLDTRIDRFKPLFMSAQNNRLGGSMVEKMLHATARRAGIDKRVTPHVIRHSFVTDLAANNAPIPSISALLGHKDAAVTLKVYTHITAGQGRAAYATSHTEV